MHGVDMSVFPSAAHLASWGALRSGNNESAGKHESGKTRKGTPGCVPLSRAKTPFGLP